MLTMMSKPVTWLRIEVYQMLDKKTKQVIHYGPLFYFFTSVLYLHHFCSEILVILILLLMTVHFITITT